ncbi:MAG: phosphatase PAP2 family protein [Dermatophilus congolensis]|nr:phosphatase PAP2 family protein [Dermatophilus congolensis]
MRYRIDPSRPTAGQAFKDFALRALAPGFVVWLLIVAGGWVLQNPLLTWADGEDRYNAQMQAGRTPLWDSVTSYWSRIGNTEIIIGTCVIVVALVWWRTKAWWFAIIPGIAIALQSTIFVIATNVVDRPRPDVPRLDPAPPTSSFPSGHVGASVALYTAFLLMAQSIETPWLRRLISAVCIVMPLLVVYARLYRGMHHVTDVIVGILNGLVCAFLAWFYLRRRATAAQ